MLLALLLSFPAAGWTAIKTETVEYRHGKTVCEGFLAYDDAAKGKVPGIIVVHEWTGLGDYAKMRATMLAKLGYAALAVDMYGKGVRAKDHEEAAKLSGIYRNDRSLMRSRAKAGLEVLRNSPRVDPSRIAAIGYCFGGTTVLEMARSGQDLRGVASFHGSLDTPVPAAKGAIKGKVRVYQGADDAWTVPGIPKFEEEMKASGADWQLIEYPGAVHSFTVKEAGNDNSKGMAYNEAADKKSWQALAAFLKDIFKK